MESFGKTRLESSNFYIFCKYIYIYIYTETAILYKDFKNTNTNIYRKQSVLDTYAKPSNNLVDYCTWY